MKLRYKIISYSSQDSKYPISNLISNSGVWQSLRFCDYPQQITLQFYEPITIKQFSIVSHPTKIPSKISMLFCLPDRQKSNNGFKFQKYGYVSYSDNQATNYKCRQCKKINDVNENALYMRLILWKNHQNSNNFFNQVGLSQINIIGTPYISGSLPVIQNRSLLHSISHLQYIEAKIELLQQFKQQFTKQDDFESAKQIKEIIKVIRLQGDRVKELDHEKRKAVADQNYQKAKKIKQQMDVIKSDTQYLANNFYDPNKKLIRPVLKDSKLKIKVDELIGITSQNQSHSGSRVSIIKKSLEHFDGQKEALSENQNSDNENQQHAQQDQQNIVESRVSYDNRVLPAILHKNKKDFKQLLKSNQNLEDAAYEDNQFIEKYTKQDEQQAPQQLAPADEANASIPIEVFGKQTIKKLYSKHWNHKLEAITAINQQCKSLLSTSKDFDKNTYRSIIFVFNKCIKQGSYPILSVNVQILNSLLVDSHSKDAHALGQLRTEIHNQLQKSIHDLFLKMGQNQKIKQSSQSMIKNMIKSQMYGTHFVYQTIHKSYNNPSLTLSPKIRKYKLGAIETMLLECGMGGKSGLPMSSIDFVSRAAEDTNGDVRKQATQLLRLMKQRGGGQKVVQSVKNRQSIKGSIVKQIQK